MGKNWYLKCQQSIQTPIGYNEINKYSPKDDYIIIYSSLNTIIIIIVFKMKIDILYSWSKIFNSLLSSAVCT